MGTFKSLFFDYEVKCLIFIFKVICLVEKGVFDQISNQNFLVLVIDKKQTALPLYAGTKNLGNLWIL